MLRTHVLPFLAFAGLALAAAPATAETAAEHAAHAGHEGHVHGAPPVQGAPATPPLTAGEQSLLDTVRQLEKSQPRDSAERSKVLSQAEETLRRLVKEFPDSSGREDYAAGAIRVMMSAQRQQEALVFWREYMATLKREDLVYRAHRFLSDMHAGLGEGKTAAQVLRDYLSAHRGSAFEAQVFDALSDALASDNHYAEAAQVLQDLLKGSPNLPATPQLRLKLARSLVLAGKAADAVPRLEAMRKDPAYAEYVQNSTLLLAFAHEFLGDQKTALAELAKVQADPARFVSAQGFLSEGEMWHRLGNRDRALAAFEKCLGMLPQGEARNGVAFRVKQLKLIGQKVPDWAIRGLDGKPIESKSLGGSHLLLAFWSTQCVPCRYELAHLKLIFQSYAGKPVQFLSVSLDPPEDKSAVEALVKKLEIPWPQGQVDHGFNSEFCRILEITATPTLALVGPDGLMVNLGLSSIEFARVLDRALSASR
jgi:tetratricopeptide (TPR) repeat protein